MSQEQRNYRRLPENVDIRFRIISLGDNPGDYIDLRGGGHSENISMGGMLFESNEMIPVGSFLEVQVNVSELEYPIYLRGRVVRLEEIVEHRKYDIGIQFTQYFEKDKEFLQNHLKELADRLFPDG